MKCPYQIDLGCPKVDTLTMTCIRCSECEYYNDGVRPTGAIEFFEIFKRELKKIVNKNKRSN